MKSGVSREASVATQCVPTYNCPLLSHPSGPGQASRHPSQKLPWGKTPQTLVLTWLPVASQAPDQAGTSSWMADILTPGHRPSGG